MEIINTILSIVLTGLSSFVLLKAQKNMEKSKNEDSATIILLRRELRIIHDRVEAAGAITEDQYVEFKDIYKVYKKLGGNGHGDAWNDKIERMWKK